MEDSFPRNELFWGKIVIKKNKNDIKGKIPQENLM